jgi:Cu(I)/Ag(I) efflux system membrane fusion protein
MKRALAVVALVAAAFAGGYFLRQPPAAPSKAQQRKVLYWVDPMHPQYKSDKPGIAPDCGMKLVPVYEGESQAGQAGPPGTVQVSAERQQLIGVKYGTVEYTTNAQTVRAAGKVAMDETRVTHVHSRTDGFVEKV